MEDLDRRIVALLASDGRLSFTDLAKETGLSVSAVHQRVRRLQERSAIKGYRAVVDHEAAGLPLTALVSITPFDASAPDDIPDRLRDIHQIVSCWSVAGEENYVLQVRVASPSDLEELLARIRAGAAVTTRTTVVLSTPWENRSPLGE
jgi:Lrp/AsnC family leucine-responsive transcriptional regulator